jgi:predicted outer membrane protein
MIAALAACVAPACSDDDDDDEVIVIDPVQQATDDGFARGTALADTAFAEISGQDYATVIGQTASIVAAMNDGVIDQADFALQIAVATDIAAFANVLASDHEIQNANLEVVVDIFGVPFAPSLTEADVATDYALGLDDLHATASSDVELAYVDLQVRNHAANLVLLDQLRDMFNDDEMGLFLDDMRTMEDNHLVQSQDLLASFF